MAVSRRKDSGEGSPAMVKAGMGRRGRKMGNEGETYDCCWSSPGKTWHGDSPVGGLFLEREREKREFERYRWVVHRNSVVAAVGEGNEDGEGREKEALNSFFLRE
ncbi:hypothetical protein FXO38_26178 [Capsicum annuum]|nr:hypothetical protein FXO38_26178 [Capsicum annuum]KAF3634641.1 hypothetical protein FXO37_26375 [Capsicum annuum]